jgi:hypothetical protein
MHSPPHPSASPQRRPSQDGVHTHAPPTHDSAARAHIVPGVQVPPHPSLGASPQGREEGGVHVGAQQPVPVQRSPVAQRVPLGHIGQPGGSAGSTPQASVEALAQGGQHVPEVQLVPDAHIVPAPHVRHTRPIPSTWSGMSVPQGTVEALGQLGQQLPPTQLEPEGHIVPVVHVRQMAPLASSTGGIGAPHATVDALGQLPQQTRVSPPLVPGGLTQLVPEGQRLPKPVQARQVGDGMGSPQSTVLPAAQLGQQTPAAPPVHVSPAAQPAVP